MNRFDYQFPVRIHFGQGCFEDSLKNELQKYGKNVMLAYGGGSLKRTGLYDRIVAMLNEAGKEVWSVKGITQAETAALGIDALEAFIKEIGLPTRWSEMGITGERMLRAAADTCFITPGCCRQMSRDEIFEIQKEVM